MKRIPYSEANYDDDTLFDKESFNLVYSSAMLNNNEIKRYEGKEEFLPLDKRVQIGGLNTHFYSQMCQLCYMPEYAQNNKKELQKLTFTPPIINLKYIDTFDFVYKGLKEFPYGMIEAKSSNVGLSYFYDGENEGIAIACNTIKSMADKGIGKNINTFPLYEHDYSDMSVVLCMVVLGKDLKMVSSKQYQKLPYPLFKMSCFNGKIYIINYDAHSGNVDFLTLSSSVKNIASFKLEIGALKFYRTHKIDCVYDNESFIFLDKMQDRCGKISISGADRVCFNPILKSLYVRVNGKHLVYKLYYSLTKPLFVSDTLNEKIAQYALQWCGNYDYDYRLRNIFKDNELDLWLSRFNYRGNYPNSYGAYSENVRIGNYSKQIDIPFGMHNDFYIANGDDADLGIKSYLKIRRTEILPHKEIELIYPTYARCYIKQRQIIFYSLDYENELGKLILFEY